MRPFENRGNGLRADLAQEALLDDADAFDLAFSRKALVKSLVAELVLKAGPWRNQLLKHARCRILPPLLDEILAQGQIGQHANDRFERHAAGELIFIVGAPDTLHYRTNRLQIIGNELECALGFTAEVLHKKLLVLHDEFLDFVEEFRLQDPLLLLAAAAQTIDLVLQRR